MACTCERPDLCAFDDGLCCMSCGQVRPKIKMNGLITSEGRHKNFHYRPLRSNSSFRLMRLHAGRRDDEITCEIFHSVLLDHPPFEALSYTWGDVTLSHKIISTEGTVSITANCEAALRDLRYSFRDRILWIDAVCIDQGNTGEKNIQVPLMRRIYSAARRVVIYVGADYRKDLQRFFAYFQHEKPSVCAADRVAQAALSSFISKPWFSRVWILQEVAVAREALLMWGNATLNWSYFSAAHINTLQLTPVDHFGLVPPVLLFTQDDKTPLKDLVTLIYAARSCRSTEPRDKIFALLGLLDHVKHTIKIDYKKPLGELQSELVMDVINQYNHLDVLTLANRETESESLNAQWLVKKIQGMESGGLCTGANFGNAAKKAALAGQEAQSKIRDLSEAEGKERHAFNILRSLEDAWNRVEEASDIWMETQEKYKALQDVQMKLLKLMSALGSRTGRWQKTIKSLSPQLQQSEKYEAAWRESLAMEESIWSKWSDANKTRGDLAEQKAEEGLIDLESTEQQNRRELVILEREWKQLQDENDTPGVAAGIEIARKKYEHKYEEWHTAEVRANVMRSNMDHDKAERSLLIENETKQRKQLSGMLALLSEAMDQQPRSDTSATHYIDKLRKLDEIIRDLRDEEKRMQRRMSREKKAWSKISGNMNHEPKKCLQEARQRWYDVKARVAEAKQDPLILRFDQEVRQYFALRHQLSYASEIQKHISRELHKDCLFSKTQKKWSDDMHLPSWVPGLETQQTLPAWTYFRHTEQTYPRCVARRCSKDHGHINPALEIRILKLDNVILDSIPSSYDSKDFNPVEFGRAFMETTSLPDKSLGNEREDFLTRFQQIYQAETRGSTFAQFQSFCQGRRRMLTAKSWVVCSGQVQTSDLVCTVYGASVPFVFRPRSGGQSFELMGECYLDGFLGPKFADDYLCLLGKFRESFTVAKTSEDLPWESVCLE